MSRAIRNRISGDRGWVAHGKARLYGAGFEERRVLRGWLTVGVMPKAYCDAREHVAVLLQVLIDSSASFGNEFKPYHLSETVVADNVINV